MVSILFLSCIVILLLIAVIDAITRMIPDSLNILFFALSFLYAFKMGKVDFIGPLLLGTFFGLQWIASRGRWTGSGDIFLGISIGFLLGSWQRALVCLFLAYILGALVAAFLLLRGKTSRHDHIAFAPFLVAACVLTLSFGDSLLQLIGLFPTG